MLNRQHPDFGCHKLGLVFEDELRESRDAAALGLGDARSGGDDALTGVVL